MLVCEAFEPLRDNDDKLPGPYDFTNSFPEDESISATLDDDFVKSPFWLSVSKFVPVVKSSSLRLVTSTCLSKKAESTCWAKPAKQKATRNNKQLVFTIKPLRFDAFGKIHAARNILSCHRFLPESIGPKSGI